MAWDDVLAAIGGALEGGGHYRDKRDARDYRKAQLDQRENELRIREMIAEMTEQGRNARTDKTEGGKDRRLETTEGGKNSRLETTEGGKNSRATMRDDTVRRGQDMNDERYWSGENPLQWDRNFLTSRGQDVSAANNRRTNATAQRGQDLGDDHYWDTSSRQWDQGQQRIDDAESNHAVDYAMGAYRNELSRRRAMRGGPVSIFAAPGATTTVTGGQASGGAAPVGPGLPPGGDTSIPSFTDWLKQTDDPEVFPSVKELFGVTPRTMPDTGQPRTPVNPVDTGQPRTPTPLSGPRPAPPVRPRAVPPPAGAAASPAGASPLEAQAVALMAKIKAQEAATGQPATDLRAQLARLRDQARGK